MRFSSSKSPGMLDLETLHTLVLHVLWATKMCSKREKCDRHGRSETKLGEHGTDETVWSYYQNSAWQSCGGAGKCHSRSRHCQIGRQSSFRHSRSKQGQSRKNIPDRAKAGHLAAKCDQTAAGGMPASQTCLDRPPHRPAWTDPHTVRRDGRQARWRHNRS